MKKAQSTRRALLSAILALIMTVSMLVGTTFAWFTDSVTSANNIIKSGNLDVSLEYWNGSAWADVGGSSELLDKDARWEPGHTEVVYLKIENEGSLALKYKLGVNIISETVGKNAAGGDLRLSDYIYFDTLDMASFVEFADRDAAMAIATESTLISEGYSKSGELAAGAAPVYVAMVVYMPATVGNEANHNGINIPEITLGVDIVATQLSAESDSFGSDYDADAQYPIKNTVNVPANSEAKIEANEVAVQIPESGEAANYTLEVSNKTVETNDVGDTVVSYEIELKKNGVKVDPASGVSYTVTIEVEKNKDVIKVTHNGNDVDFFHYEPSTGIITFTTTSFSPFAVYYAEADSETVYAPSTPEAAEKLEKAEVVAVDENGNEYASFKAAVESGAEKLYLKAGADLGQITHLNVVNDLTIYGNGAYISSGERDLAVDIYEKLEDDLDLTVYGLNGIGVWGTRSTEYTVNVTLYNCENLSRIYLNGTSGANNIAVYNCSATRFSETAYENIIGDTAVYSNANGSVYVEGSTFTGIGCAVNLNHKVAGEQKVTVVDSTFVDCSTEGSAAYYAPIRLYNSVEGANQTVTVESNAFIYSEGKAPINGANILLNKIHDGKEAAGTIKANVQMTSVVAGEGVDLTYALYTADDLFAFAAAINAVVPYTASVYDNATVLLMNDIDLGGREWIPIGDDRSQRTEFHGVFDGQGNTVFNVTITKKTDRDDENKSSYGLFGNLKGTVKNLTVDGVSVSGAPKFVGALVGRMNGGLIENCHVVNSSVTCNNWTIGGLVGQLNDGKISGCSVKDSKIEGYAGVGAIVGLALNSGERVIENCSVVNCEIAQNGSFGGSFDAMFGTVVGALYNGSLTVDLNGCTAEGNTVKGAAVNTLCGYITDGDKLNIDGKPCAYVADSASLIAALKAGGYVVLAGDVEMSATASISNADFVLDGNGYTITQAADCANNIALFDITYGKVAFNNVTFDGISGGAVVRTVFAKFDMDCAVVKNSKHTVDQGLLRLIGESTIENSTFVDNECKILISFNYDAAEEKPQTVKNCVFEGNVCSGVGVVYYVDGSGAIMDGNRFVDNTVAVESGNAATVYLGFTSGNVITNNLFKGNSVTVTTSKRASGGIMFGYEAELKGNAFIDNKVIGENAKGNDVCVSVYYTDIDLSGNYWGGEAPVENVNYFVEHTGNQVTVNDYLTEWGE